MFASKPDSILNLPHVLASILSFTLCKLASSVLVSILSLTMLASKLLSSILDSYSSFDFAGDGEEIVARHTQDHIWWCY